MKVLITDDQPSVHEYIEKTIDWEALGVHTVLHAYQGRECLDIALSQKPAVLLMDIRMPVMDGLEVLDALKKANASFLKIIVISAYGEFSYALTALRNGADNYLLKPIAHAELKSALEASITAHLQDCSASLRNFLALGEGGFPFFPSVFESGKEVRGAILHGAELHKGLTVPGGSISFSLSPEEQFVLLMGETLEHLAGRCAQETMIAAGDAHVVRCEDELRLLYAEALLALERRSFWKLEDRIVYCGGPIPEEHLNQTCDLLLTSLDEVQDRRAMVEEVVRKLFSALRDTAPNKKLLTALCTQIVHRLCGEIGKLPLLAGELSSDLLESFEQCTNAWQLERSLADSICFLIQPYTAPTAEELGVVKCVQRYLAENISEDITLDKLAQQFYLNKYELCRRFKNGVGKSVWKYLTELRIRHAKYLLTHTSLKVYEVAENCGFHSATYFSNVFLKSTGIRPQDWRSVGA